MGSSPDDGQTAVGTTTHTTLSLAVHEDKVLVYDPADVEQVELHVSNDVRTLAPEPGDTAVRRELGQTHVHLSLHFKTGKQAHWVPLEEVVEQAAPRPVTVTLNIDAPLAGTELPAEIRKSIRRRRGGPTGV